MISHELHFTPNNVPGLFGGGGFGLCSQIIVAMGHLV